MCPSCQVGWHFTCIDVLNNGAEKCCCPNIAAPVAEVEEKRGRLKDAANMADPLSTGRKRAAQLFPIPEDGSLDCEWALLKNAGGGVIPIIGCMGRPATDRHHGPDKDVIHNEVGNVHRLCSHCHNRWHALNDPFYGSRPKPGTPFIPLIPFVCKEHDPETLATDAERMKNEIDWSIKPAKRARE